MLIGVPTETAAGESRVALVPEAVRKLVARGAQIVVQSGAGQAASFPDSAYQAAGATLVATAAEVWHAALIVKVAPPSEAEAAALAPGAVLIGFLNPLGSPRATRALAAAGVTAFAMESIPRISRAQAMDALSSQSNVAGYRAALLGAGYSGRFFPMLMTAGKGARARGGRRRLAGACDRAAAGRADDRL